MTREIKFRAWDTIKNIFVDEGEITFYFYGDSRIEVHPNSITYIGDQVHNGEPERGRFIIQQYTGLKDKNGKEIFEGDILIFYIRLDADIDDAGHVFKCKGQVIFDNGTFIIKNIEPKVRPFFYFDWDEMKIGEHCEELYVGGNIYQNPELVGN